MKDEAKEQARRDEINNITSSIKELHDIVEEQNAQMKDLLNKFDNLGKIYNYRVIIFNTNNLKIFN